MYARSSLPHSPEAARRKTDLVIKFCRQLAQLKACNTFIPPTWSAWSTIRSFAIISSVRIQQLSDSNRIVVNPQSRSSNMVPCIESSGSPPSADLSNAGQASKNPPRIIRLCNLPSSNRLLLPLRSLIHSKEIPYFQRSSGCSSHRHKMERTFRLAILHCHFDLDMNEQLVEHGSTSAPWRRAKTSENIRASCCLLSDGVVRPYEFCYASVRADATESDLANLDQRAFFKVFNELLGKYNAVGLFGLYRYPRDDFLDELRSPKGALIST